MTDARLAAALADAKALEAEVSAYFGSTSDVAERDRALALRRQVTAHRKALEQWLGARAMRAQLLSR